MHLLGSLSRGLETEAALSYGSSGLGRTSCEVKCTPATATAEVSGCWLDGWAQLSDIVLIFQEASPGMCMCNHQRASRTGAVPITPKQAIG